MKKVLLLLSSVLTGVGLLSAASTDTAPVGKTQLEKCSIELTPSQLSGLKTNAPTRGDEPYLDFTYAGEPVNAYSYPNVSSGYIYLAMKIPVADQTPYIGAQITGVTFYSPTTQFNINPVKSASVFVTDNLSSAPEQTTEANLSSSGFGENFVELDQPFTITGEKAIFVGYRFKYVANSYYIVADENPTDAQTCLFANVAKETDTPSLLNVADQIGSLCISARISGDNLPMNLLSIRALAIPEYVAPGSPFEFHATVKNMGANTIQSAKFKAILGENEYTSDYSFSKTLEIGEERLIKISNIPNTTEGVFKVAVSPLSANDVPVENPETFNSASSSFNSELTRPVVIEEGTGNWCQFCPRGIVMMEYFKENYPDWVLIAVHGGNTEPMFVPGYGEWLNKYAAAFPAAMANRYMNVDIAGDIASYYTPIYNYFNSTPGYVTPSIEAATTEDGTSVDVTAKSNFIFDTEVKHYLSLVIVEDNVGPYAQQNYYYKRNELPQWNDIPSGTKIKYNEVARAILPDLDAFPAQIEKNVEYSYTANMPLSYTYGKKPNSRAGTEINPQNARVIALVTNSVTGAIVAACQTPIYCTGVKGAVSDNVNVSVNVEAGSIVVNGADNFSVYTLDGRQVSSKDVPAGIYIVKTEGKSFKVMVK
ncbi:MAG: hypothetical protein K2G67_00585 [Muribaculaceae bacterium]|nr:hypothetical protein [Muribaculaceae bacterium]